MTVIRPNSITGITSITAQANEINVFRHNGVLAGLQLNGVNHHTSAGVSTFHTVNVLGNLDVAGVLTYQDVTNVDSLGIGTFRTGINVSGGQLDVGSNIKLGNAGVVTATSFVGNGTNASFLNLTKSSTTAYNTAATTNDSTANLINSGAAGHATLQFQSVSGGSANTGQATISVFNESSGSKNTALTFGTRQNSDATVRERLRIESNGNVKVSTGTQYKGFNVSNGSSLVAELVGLDSDNDNGALALWDGGVKKTFVTATGYSYFNGGNIGINSTSPSTPLEIHTNASAAWKFRINTSVSDGAGFYQRANGDFECVLRDASNNNNFISGNGGGLEFSTSGTEKLRIKSNGYVGVNETDPQYPLHVAGATTNSAPTGTGILMGLQHSHAVIHLNAADDMGCLIDFTTPGVDRKGGILYYHSNNSVVVNRDAMSFHTASTEKLRINSDGDLMVGTTGSSGAKIQIGNHTFAGTNFAYNNDRVGFQNNGHLTCISNCSTYNDATHPGYGFVLVQGASTSSYNVWGLCPDGPAKGNSLNLHYGAQSANIHQPSNKKFQFTGEGYALTPNMPYCMLGRGSSFSIASVTGTKIIFDTKTVDRGGNYNTSNGRFTAPVAGDYLLMLIVEYNPSAGVNQFHTGIWKNGSHSFGSGFDSWNNHGDGIKGSSMVLTANLALNDYIEFATYHGSGGTQQLTGGRCKATIRFLG